MIENKYTAFGIFVACAVIVWNLLDWLYAKFITHSAFQFSASTNLMIPLGAALVVGYLLFLRNN